MHIQGPVRHTIQIILDGSAVKGEIGLRPGIFF
jgi:hypothetical protein